MAEKQSSTSSNQETDVLEPDISCGYTETCKPKCLQKFANPKVYLLIISLCSIIQGENQVILKEISIFRVFKLGFFYHKHKVIPFLIIS